MNDFHSPREPLIPGSLVTDEQVKMPRIMARNIRAHAAEHVPEEVCGLIGGEGDVFSMLMRCPNHSIENRHNFRIEPVHFYEAIQAFGEKGQKLRAIYHSHVSTEPKPSASDLAAASGELFIVIYSVQADELRVWRGDKPIDLEVIG